MYPTMLMTVRIINNNFGDYYSGYKVFEFDGT